MKTRFFSMSFIVALFVVACTPIAAGSGAPIDPAQPPVDRNTASDPAASALVSAPARVEQEPRLWSGGILNSDSNSPDHAQTIQVTPVVTPESACSSDDTLERKYGGCIE